MYLRYSESSQFSERRLGEEIDVAEVRLEPAVGSLGGSGRLCHEGWTCSGHSRDHFGASSSGSVLRGQT